MLLRNSKKVKSKINAKLTREEIETHRAIESSANFCFEALNEASDKKRLELLKVYSPLFKKCENIQLARICCGSGQLTNLIVSSNRTSNKQ